LQLPGDVIVLRRICVEIYLSEAVCETVKWFSVALSFIRVDKWTHGYTLSKCLVIFHGVPGVRLPRESLPIISFTTAFAAILITFWEQSNVRCIPSSFQEMCAVLVHTINFCCDINVTCASHFAYRPCALSHISGFLWNSRAFFVQVMWRNVLRCQIRNDIYTLKSFHWEFRLN
jgi:hypothetical protein